MRTHSLISGSYESASLQLIRDHADVILSYVAAFAKIADLPQFFSDLDNEERLFFTPRKSPYTALDLTQLDIFFNNPILLSCFEQKYNLSLPTMTEAHIIAARANIVDLFFNQILILINTDQSNWNRFIKTQLDIRQLLLSAEGRACDLVQERQQLIEKLANAFIYRIGTSWLNVKSKPYETAGSDLEETRPAKERLTALFNALKRALDLTESPKSLAQEYQDTQKKLIQDRMRACFNDFKTLEKTEIEDELRKNILILRDNMAFKLVEQSEQYLYDEVYQQFDALMQDDNVSSNRMKYIATALFKVIRAQENLIVVDKAQIKKMLSALKDYLGDKAGKEFLIVWQGMEGGAPQASASETYGTVLQNSLFRSRSIELPTLPLAVTPREDSPLHAAAPQTPPSDSREPRKLGRRLRRVESKTNVFSVFAKDVESPRNDDKKQVGQITGLEKKL